MSLVFVTNFGRNECEIKLEMMFMKNCAPNLLLVQKDGILCKLKGKGHLKFEASSYTAYHSLPADLI